MIKDYPTMFSMRGSHWSKKSAANMISSYELFSPLSHIYLEERGQEKENKLKTYNSEFHAFDLQMSSYSTCYMLNTSLPVDKKFLTCRTLLEKQGRAHK